MALRPERLHSPKADTPGKFANGTVYRCTECEEYVVVARPRASAAKAESATRTGRGLFMSGLSAPGDQDAGCTMTGNCRTQPLRSPVCLTHQVPGESKTQEPW